MLKKTIIRFILLATLLAPIITPVTFKRNAPSENQIQEIQQIKIDYSESILEELRNINKLEIMQASLKKEFTIKGNYENFLLKNNKEVTVRANVFYKLDLNNIEPIIGVNEFTVIAAIEKDISINDFSYST